MPKSQRSKSASKLENLSKAARKISDAIPNPSATILSVTDGTPENDYVHIRGSHKNLGKEVPRRFLTALGGDAIPPPSEASGRLELAEQVVSREQTHSPPASPPTGFGTTSSGGASCPPSTTSAPWASRSIPSQAPRLAGGRSYRKQSGPRKDLIRQIVLSKTYRQSANSSLRISILSYLADTDPENILLSQGSRPTPTGRSDPRFHARHLWSARS